jgi:hypothetical protein
VCLRRVATFVPPLLIGLLALPFILRQNSWMEWSNAYWLLQRQTAHVEAHGLPTLFLHNQSGAYNPFFTYYAGFTFSLLAYPAAVFGAWPVFVASVTAAIVSGYLGIWWTARNLGLSPQLAILPTLTFTTTPYVLSEIYGRGAWSELVAVNAAAVAFGAATTLLWHPDRHRGRALAALIAATAVVAGTHNLTLMLSAIALPLLLAALLPLRGTGGAPIWPAMGRVVAGLLLGVGLTAAWLIPNLWFGPSTWIAQPSGTERDLMQNGGLVSISNLLSPLPARPDDWMSRWVYTQGPTTVMAWSLVAFAVVFWVRRRGAGSSMKAAAGLTVVGLALVLLIVNPHWWLSFPRVVKTVQFPFRLVPYLAMAVALGAIVGLTALRGPTRRWLVGALVALVAVQAAAGIGIVVNSEAGGPAEVNVPPPRRGDVPIDRLPPTFGGAADLQFRVVGQPTGRPASRAPGTFEFDDLLTSDFGTSDGTGRASDRLIIPVVWSPFVRVTGDARISGRDPAGMAIVTLTRTEANGRWRLTVGPAHPWQLVAGRVISLLSVLAIVILGLVAFRRRRTAPPQPPGGSPGRPASPRAAIPA